MTQEEKAQAYDKAIEVIRKCETDKYGCVIGIKPSDIFRELQESEDEKILRTLKEIVNWGCAKNISVENDVELTDCFAWLEKQGEQKSLDDIAKEVIKDKDTATSFLKSCGIMNENGELADEYKIEQGKQKPAWSEEDESMLQNILECLKNGWRKLPTDILKYESWLKSLKPQTTWKPSEEQMEALYKYAEQNNCDGSVLTTLYQDLKKLKG